MIPLYSSPLWLALGLLACCVGSSVAAAPQAADTVRLYIGTYSGPQSKGIYMLDLDLTNGTLSKPELACKAMRPSFLALSPNRHVLYAVAENSGAGKHGGALVAFAVDPDTGKLTALNEQPSGGSGPCYVAIDKTGKVALVANYSSGSVAALPIGSDGRLEPAATVDQHTGKGTDPKRQEGPHAHCIDLDPANHFALCCDLGLDKIFVYRFDAAHASWTPNNPPFGTVAPGSGPRHIAFHPNGKFLYVINEMASTITLFDYDAGQGILSDVRTVSTLPSDFKGFNTAAEVAVHPSGKFVYASNRGDDSIAAFAVDPQSGKLTLIAHTPSGGKTPRHFAIDPSGKFLIAANQHSDNVVVFSIDAATGRLKPTGATAKVPAAVCVIFAPPTK